MPAAQPARPRPPDAARPPGHRVRPSRSASWRGPRAATVARGAAPAPPRTSSTSSPRRRSRGAGRPRSRDRERSARDLQEASPPGATARAVKRADAKLWTTAALNLWTEPGDGPQARRARRPASRSSSPAGRPRAGSRSSSTASPAGSPPATSPTRSRAAGRLGGPAAPRPPACRWRRAPTASGRPASRRRPSTSTARCAPRSRRSPSYGGWDAHGEHASGRRIDIMISDAALGDAIAEFLRPRRELDLYDIIWRQHIWTPVDAPPRAGAPWRTAGRPRPTTTTTCTSRSTDRHAAA